ncbi:serine/threonine protein kinase [Nocardiopsis sp. Huas11]|uniref:serine/threonine-protein kinase n=1 Tax=Nocardiopsis sp. Huas11 TaxID=2183912 RepID=UPI000EB338EB|nr:serine/threonine-protein kinase [Nocardiopsis sp. Huas11]RKS06274.1 serine/threonine protein kinase [Nocardiopsis sp. Huas11]
MQPLSPDDPRQVGPFRVIALLGSGGMGRVHLGLDPDGAPAAVKVVRADLAYDPDFRERFTRELASAQRVHGPGTPRVLAADPAAEIPWLATEYVMGPSLLDLVERTGSLPEPAARLLVRGVAQALERVHSQGLAHRDLKPGNVMVSAAGPQVIDFGIARALEPEQRGAGDDRVVGTPGYMAPEAGRGEDSGGAADVFALGGVLVWALTGSGPFGDGHPSAVLYRTQNVDPDLSRVPESLRPLVASCLGKDPGRRPSAADVLRALGGPAAPATTAAAWLPPSAAQAVDAVAEEYRAAVRNATETAPAADGADTSARRGRRLLLLGSAATALVLVAAAGTIAAVGYRNGQTGTDAGASEAAADEPVQRDQCDPTEHLAPEFVDAASAVPTLTSSTDLLGVRFSTDGSVLAVGGDQAIALWDWEEGAELARIRLDLPSDAAVDPVFSPDDCRIAFATADGAHVYSLETGEHTVHREGRELSHVEFSPDGSELAIADNTMDTQRGVYTIDADSGEVVQTFDGFDYARFVGYSPGGGYLGAHGFNDARVWDTGTGEEVASGQDLPPTLNGSVQILDEEGTVLTAHADGPVQQDLDEDDATFPFIPEEEPRGELVEFTLNEAADRLYTVYATEQGDDGVTQVDVAVWEFSTREEIDEAPDELAWDLDAHPDGTVAAGVSGEGDAVLLVNGETLETIRTFG